MSVNYLSLANVSSSLANIVETYIGDNQESNYIKFDNGVMIEYGSYYTRSIMGDPKFEPPYEITITYPALFSYVPRIYVSTNITNLVFVYSGTRYSTDNLIFRTISSGCEKMVFKYKFPLAYDVLVTDTTKVSIDYIEASLSWLAIGTWK